MITGMAAARKAKEMDVLDNESDRIINCFGANPAYTTRVSSRLAKRLLLKDVCISNGRFFRVTAKSVGCGVYQVISEDA